MSEIQELKEQVEHCQAAINGFIGMVTELAVSMDLLREQVAACAAVAIEALDKHE